MAIRLSGLTSGMDTDAIVQELVSAYSKKTEKYEKASTKLTWKQDSWKNLNTKIYDLYTKVSNMRFSSAYNLRKSTVSDATKATVTASSSAVTGTQTLNIKSTAQASYLTGGQLPEYIDGKEITSDSTLKDLGYEGKSGFFKVKAADGTSQKINFTEDTKISEVITKLREAGVNASYDENNRRIFVNAKKSGEANDFNLIGDSSEGLDVLTRLGLNTSLIKFKTDDQGNVIKDNQGNPIKEFTEAAGNYATFHRYYQEAQEANADGTWAYLKDLYAEYLEKIDQNKEYNNTKHSLENNIGAWKIENRAAERDIAKLKEENPGFETNGEDVFKAAFDPIYEAMNDAFDPDLSEDAAKEILSALDGKQLYTEDREITEEASNAIKDAYKAINGEAAEITDEQMQAIVRAVDANAEKMKVCCDYMEFTEKQALITENNTKISEAEAKVDAEDEKINANNEFLKANAVLDEVYLATKDLKTEEERTANVDDMLAKMATSADEAAVIFADEGNKYSKGNANKIKGSDAVIELNGVTYTSESNNFSINGLSINTLAKTNGEITINTTIDTQGIYDKVKDFLTEYNNVINEMCKLYNAESAGDYEPLTDEEKEAMSDEQIEKWETKIKDSLLRRDTTLNSIMSTMVNTMAQTIEIGGQKLSLSTFGIHTLGFLNAPKNENYAFHIDGDEDDENTSGKEDELRKAIEENPDRVEEFMKKLSENLYTAIDNKMKSTELSSAYKVYNDKEMDKELSKYAQTIAKWEEKVKDKEDYYFKQFSQMEVALSKLQNQTSSLSGLLGM